MGESIYNSYWQAVLPEILQQLKNGKRTAQIVVKELAQFGKRQSYYANFLIRNGKLTNPDNAFAQGRDLFAVLKELAYFKENLIDKTVQITITKDLLLKMEVLQSAAPDFYTDEDFNQLNRFAKQIKIAGNEEHKKTYDYLKTTYTKTAYWAREVQKNIFPRGAVAVLQKPTNQANKFEFYQWAKIYPNEEAYDYEALAFTVGINTDREFVIKIDTVGLGATDERRILYLTERGDEGNSVIVKALTEEEVLAEGWEQLIAKTASIILEQQPAFDALFKKFQGLNDVVITPEKAKTAMIERNGPLNTIYYGPPGTGKTYELQSLFNRFTIQKTVQTKEEFLEEQISELTWWETVAATLADLKKATVPEIEKHEFMKIKVKQSSTTNVKQVIWGSLQSRTDANCENVKFTDRREPAIFWKDEHSVWTVLDEKMQSETPEILEFVTRVKNFKPSAGSVQKNYKMVTFHQNFSYEDFVEGIKPVFNKYSVEDLEYQIEHGVFYQACNEAAKLAGYVNLQECINDTEENRRAKIASAEPYALFIDEVNRANVSSVLGELITLIEDDKRLGNRNEVVDIVLPYSKNRFGVPGNLHIAGTMNTADRSVEALDTALRRRFVFKAMAPMPELLHPKEMLNRFYNQPEFKTMGWEDEPFSSSADLLYSLLGIDDNIEQALQDQKYDDTERLWLKSDFDVYDDSQFTGVRLDLLLAKINQRLTVLLSKDHTIGHAWFIHVYNLNDLRETFKNKILPLLAEYFYNDYAKIGLVLGKAFVKSTTVQAELFSNFHEAEELASEYNDRIVYSLNDPMLLDIKDFQSIYGR